MTNPRQINANYRKTERLLEKNPTPIDVGVSKAVEEAIETSSGGLPEHTSADAGKVLKVTAQNKLAWATDEQGHAQVQANWDETDNTQPSYIQNKPTIPEGVPAFTTSDDGKILGVTVDNSGTEPVAELEWVNSFNGMAYYLQVNIYNNINTFYINNKEVTNAEFYGFINNAPEKSTFPATIYDTTGFIATIGKFTDSILLHFNFISGGRLGRYVYSLSQNSFSQNKHQVSNSINFRTSSAVKDYIPFISEKTQEGICYDVTIGYKPYPTGTPAIASGDAGKILAVKSDETGTEWVTPQIPPYTSADAGKVLSVNASGELEWITPGS